MYDNGVKIVQYEQINFFLVFWKVYTKKHTAKLFFGTVHGDKNHCARYLIISRDAATLRLYCAFIPQ